ncbi:transcriptional regulator with XRE-family HTH domain [Bacillus sp. SORGH_AS 510]|uniref:helix-turn-helix domain-containing protein n=1 Tax=Bacillus sp. SORGH_AS_0510 TaxID=3041771 RepID=UPI0027882009|nr:helix-turn-helix domain-containing protein [Bacillus sp. SORGH_AS_0510]MDQ1146568.1 transcriptional regulator with XRE-family HTH domain [Bacillus sp. SORGH_AS_0510]
MFEGEVIKFYRIKAGLTQEELGKGICTAKHVSKIERGSTSYSPELISLFSERLNIDIKQEIANFEMFEKNLNNWHNAIIKIRMSEVEAFKSEFDQTPFINAPKYVQLYQLLLARYYILKNEFNKAYDILQALQNDELELQPFEKNLLFHVLGIYYISNYNNSSTENHHKALHFLKEIDFDTYGNLEYYYHLAVAYYWIDSKVMTYAYAEKALRYFKETSNFLRAINAESLMLLQVGNDIHVEFEEIRNAYINLINDSEALNAPDKKGMLLNNLGYEYFKRKDFVNAQMYFKEALQMAEKGSVLYIQRLTNYLKSSIKGELLRKSVLKTNIQRGLTAAEALNNRHYQILLKLLLYSIDKNDANYFHYIEKTALPYFIERKHNVLMKRYGKELYTKYVENGEFEKAIEVSNLLLEDVE